MYIYLIKNCLYILKKIKIYKKITKKCNILEKKYNKIIKENARLYLENKILRHPFDNITGDISWPVYYTLIK